ncbi:MAG TPA: dihydroorotate dehydrogenase electron transfer subunit [Nitrospirae bacterium]|nr:dihydroorotate dehydrogenase electron transfer subunit [Nitrospirota bacterium]
MTEFFSAQLISQEVIKQDYRIATFLPLIKPEIPPIAGQFYMIQVSDMTDPLLKRPFSIFSYDNGIINFLYRIVGKGTRQLSTLTIGKEVEIIGPLGKPYPISEERFVAVAGGSGIASIFGLLSQNRKKGILFYGAKDMSELVLIDRLKEITSELIITTDNGSLGFMGNTLDAIREKKELVKGLSIYGCGPKPMLKAISEWSIENNQECYLSLEERMACGIGACLSCVVKTLGGLKSICKDGPVFNAKEIVWD